MKICKLLKKEMFNKLLGNNFTKLERKIVYFHYYDGLTMKEISNKINFSESRVCQMHSEILKRLRQKIDLNPKYLHGVGKYLEK